jgi:hypothetical protein
MVTCSTFRGAFSMTLAMVADCLPSMLSRNWCHLTLVLHSLCSKAQFFLFWLFEIDSTLECTHTASVYKHLSQNTHDDELNH